jgi:hypothetical protein
LEPFRGDFIREWKQKKFVADKRKMSGFSLFRRFDIDGYETLC